VPGLPWLRLACVTLLTVLGLALWRQLYQSGWNEWEAAVIGLGVTLLPGAQVAAGWATCWPHVLALVLAVAGFSAIETELERGGLKRIIALLGGVMIYCLAGLIYQSNVLFALVPIAGVLLVRSARERLADWSWLTIHLGALFTGLGVSYLLVRSLFRTGVFHESIRMQFESNPVTKLGWFFYEALPNAFALYALRDNFNTGALIFWGAVLLVVTIIAFGYRAATRSADPAARKKWPVCFVLMPFLAHAVSLVAAERSIGYRVMFALSGLMLVLVVYTFRSQRLAGKLKLPAYYAALGLTVGVAAFTAHGNALDLIAEPQGNEWEIVHNTVVRATFKGAMRVYLITPTPDDRSTERMFADEFGSLSSDSDWAPKEMFRTALRERFGEKLPQGVTVTYTLGRAEPAPGSYDVLVDFRRLKKMRPI
ncbi:MAG: hypothetical protein JWQ83_870, partial [Lacunisphaera sp.]|nr:hypothetical protein [Lacunisphaera sp.]